LTGGKNSYFKGEIDGWINKSNHDTNHKKPTTNTRAGDLAIYFRHKVIFKEMYLENTSIK